jgi:hypothetical protein
MRDLRPLVLTLEGQDPQLQTRELEQFAQARGWTGVSEAQTARTG